MAICLDRWDKERDRYTDVHSKNINNNSNKKKKLQGSKHRTLWNSLTNIGVHGEFIVLINRT